MRLAPLQLLLGLLACPLPRPEAQEHPPCADTCGSDYTHNGVCDERSRGLPCETSEFRCGCLPGTDGTDCAYLDPCTPAAEGNTSAARGEEPVCELTSTARMREDAVQPPTGITAGLLYIFALFASVTMTLCMGVCVCGSHANSGTGPADGRPASLVRALEFHRMAAWQQRCVTFEWNLCANVLFVYAALFYMLGELSRRLPVYAPLSLALASVFVCGAANVVDCVGCARWLLHAHSRSFGGESAAVLLRSDDPGRLPGLLLLRPAQLYRGGALPHRADL